MDADISRDSMWRDYLVLSLAQTHVSAALDEKCPGVQLRCAELSNLSRFMHVSSHLTRGQRKRNGGECEIARGFAARPSLRSGPHSLNRSCVQLRYAELSNLSRFMHVSSHLTHGQRKRNGGEGEIRTHVPELPDHPIS